MTDDAGNFGFSGLPNGDYSLVVEKEEGYERFSHNVSVFQMRGSPGGNYMISVRLRHKSGMGPRPGVVKADLAGVSTAALEYYKKGGDLVARADRLAGDPGNASAVRGDRLAAIEQFKLAINEHPRFSAAYNDMGVQYLKLNELGDAIDAFRTATNIAPDSFAPMLNLGMVMVEIKKYSEAEKVLRSAISAREGSAPAHFYLGQALANLGRFDEAIVELNKGLSLGGEAMAGGMKEAHRILAIIYGSRGEKARQADELEKYLRLAPDARDAEQLRALVEQLRAAGPKKPL